MDNGLFSGKSLRLVILSVIALISSQCSASLVLAQRTTASVADGGAIRSIELSLFKSFPTPATEP
jgi:hypothetical protein